jgi:hypothetical protein
MAKKTTVPTRRQKPPARRAASAQQQKIAAALAELDQLAPKSAKAAKAIALFKSWLQDESGYDEQTWPRLKKALDRERVRVGARRLFNG